MRTRTAIAAALCAALGTSCSLQEQHAPALVGPSELSISISVAATPDVLPTDGASRAVVTAAARDAYGIPLSNLSLRAAILEDGVAVDLGALSAHSLVTDSSGRATVMYTAPAIHGQQDTGTTVDIGITPVGTNYANAVVRVTTIRLVPVVPVR